jgi:phosphoglycerate dehydrogenase-like enzyme
VLGDEPCETWTLDRLPELAATADVLAVALPLTDDTRGIVSAAVIAAMKPGAVFVNVGRGDLVDEPALIEALRSGRLGGAGLDVFATEPLPADSPIWDLPNVIVTPHSSAHTPASGENAAEIFFANLARYARGESLHNEH